MLRKMKSKENLKGLLEKSLLRKECTKMMRFIIESKNKGENKNSKNKDVKSRIMKKVMKSHQHLAMAMMKFGTKFFLNKSLFKSQLLRNHHQLPTNPLTIRLLKTQVWLEMKKTVNMKSHG